MGYSSTALWQLPLNKRYDRENIPAAPFLQDDYVKLFRLSMYVTVFTMGKFA